MYGHSQISRVTMFLQQFRALANCRVEAGPIYPICASLPPLYHQLANPRALSDTTTRIAPRPEIDADESSSALLAIGRLTLSANSNYAQADLPMLTASSWKWHNRNQSDSNIFFFLIIVYFCRWLFLYQRYRYWWCDSVIYARNDHPQSISLSNATSSW